MELANRRAGAVGGRTANWFQCDAAIIWRILSDSSPHPCRSHTGNAHCSYRHNYREEKGVKRKI